MLRLLPLLELFTRKISFLLDIDDVFLMRKSQTIFQTVFESKSIEILTSIYYNINVFYIQLFDLQLFKFGFVGFLSVNVIHGRFLVVVASSLLLACLLILVLKNLKKNNTDLELDSTILSKSIQNEEISDLIIRNKVYMSKEKENAILEALISYEETKFFLKKDVCLNQLAFHSGINEKHIAYIIKKYRGKDFATYVNELRVYHIVECLKVEPIYLQYKISYLATQCGFTSHSGFSITFKKVIGMSPSSFINELKNKSAESYV